MDDRPPYQPFWCEENIWHLAASAGPGPGERLVMIITGATDHVACWQQRAAAEGEPVLWDYHVVLAIKAPDGWRIWDLDTRLGCPISATAWLTGTFPCADQVPLPFQPRMLLLPASDYRRDLRSDRRHMRDAGGRWQQPPPPWPAIDGGSVELRDYLRQARAGLGLQAIGRVLAGGVKGSAET